MGRLRITDLRDIGFPVEERMIVPSVVPSVQQMIEDNKKKEQKPVVIPKIYVVTQYIKNKLQKDYPSSSVLIVGADEENAGTTSISLEVGGDKDKVAAALGHCMTYDQSVVRLVNKAMMYYVNECPSGMAEICISALQEIILDLKKKNDIDLQINFKKREIKRLKQEGRKDLLALKEKELDDLLIKKERKRLHRIKSIESLAKARAVKAEKKKQREQKERDRNRQQPNFAKMAKKKRQKIAARQADKKKKSSNCDDKIKSCSMFVNVG